MDFKRNFDFEIHLKIYDFVTLEKVWNSINFNIFLELIVKCLILGGIVKMKVIHLI